MEKIETRYYKFFDNRLKTKPTTVQVWIRLILSYMLPIANPDFEESLPQVKIWLIEFENKEPVREIGLNNNEQVLVKMPFGPNIGYWTDNNYTEQYFIKKFNAGEVDKSEFEKYWNIKK